MTVDVLIPTYKPGRKFAALLHMLEKQTVPPDQILVMNTEEKFWNGEGLPKLSQLKVRHLSKAEFDHGGTRNRAAGYSKADILVFMTDDAVPADTHLLERLAEAVAGTGPEGEPVAAAYAKQLPAEDCRFIERYTRSFNYPDTGAVKTKADLPRLGIKTYFASNVCCAYRREIFEQLGGFVESTIFNEDMLFAAKAVQAGYAVAYVPEARVVHSHNLSPMEQFRRNFDMGVSQADHPEVFADVPAEGEGIRLVKQTARYVLRKGRPWLLPSLVVTSGCKYLGYRLGKRYRALPHRLVLWCSMSPYYWNRKWRKQP